MTICGPSSQVASAVYSFPWLIRVCYKSVAGQLLLIQIASRQAKAGNTNLSNSTMGLQLTIDVDDQNFRIPDGAANQGFSMVGADFFYHTTYSCFSRTVFIENPASPVMLQMLHMAGQQCFSTQYECFWTRIRQCLSSDEVYMSWC